MSRPLPTPAVALTGALLAIVVGLAAVLLLERGGESSRGAGRGPVTSVAPAGVGHVHGLGVDPGDASLYVASHHGVFRVAPDAEPGARPEHVAGRWQDTMGFAVIGPGHFLASGHPALDEDLPAHLGLVESRDGAETWQPVSLLGEADLHAIEPVGDGAYAYDSATGALMHSADRRTWDLLDRRPLVDLAVDPGRPHVVLATTADGALLRYDTRKDEPARVRLPGAPRLTQIDVQPGGPLVGAGADGSVYVGGAAPGDSGGWQRVGSVTGPVTALDAVPGRWHVANNQEVLESTDDGATWTAVVEVGG